MFERLKRLYEDGKINEAGLQNAVRKGWITQAEMNGILGEAEGKSEDSGDAESGDAESTGNEGAERSV